MRRADIEFIASVHGARLVRIRESYAAVAAVVFVEAGHEAIRQIQIEVDQRRPAGVLIDVVPLLPDGYTFHRARRPRGWLERLSSAVLGTKYEDKIRVVFDDDQGGAE